MKKVIISCVILFAITGCDYTEQERKQFQMDCITKHDYEAKNKFDKIAVSCACKNWSLRKDIIPDDTGTLVQYTEELTKCYSIKIKDDYKMRQKFVEICQNFFLEIYPSFADKMFAAYGYSTKLMSEFENSIPYFPEMYERDSNKELVDCACSRLSLRDDFTLPGTIEKLKQEFKKESKICQKENKMSKK